MSPEVPSLPLVVRDAAAGGFVRVNPAFERATGLTARELATEPLAHWLHPEDRPAFESARAGGEGRFTARHRGAAGEWVSLSWMLQIEDGATMVLGRPGEEVVAGPSTDEPENDMAETLDAMVRLVELQNPGKRCSVLLVGEGNRVSVGAGPSLPPEYNAAVEGLAIGPSVGSCGTAAYWNVPVIVEDIRNDPLWRDLKEHALRAGLAACWSHPVRSRSGEVLGAIALYDAVVGGPTREQFRGLESAARMVGLAVERGRAAVALRHSEAAARAETRLLGHVTDAVTAFVDTADWARAADRLVRGARDLTGSRHGLLVTVDGNALRVVARQGGRPEELPDSGLAVGDALDLATCAEARAWIARLGAAPLPEAREDDGVLGRLTGEGGTHEALAAPIRCRGDLVAVLVLGEPGRAYRHEDVRVAEVLARAAAVIYDNHARQERADALEHQLQQAAKMEALGVLAGGIAHDFNNILATVLGNAELALEMLDDETGAAPMLREIVTAASRASGFCNQMLAYAGRGARAVERLEFNEMVRELWGLLQVAISKKAEVHLDLHPEPLHLEGDENQLRQVVMNLVTNASESLEGGAGSIDIATDVRHLDALELARLRPPVSLGAGDYLRLRVADSGCGMTPEVRSRIFDPFFTTKFAGRGLGLAAVQGIVRSHRGAITIETDPGRGTTFTVLLPLVEAPAGAGRPARLAPVPGRTPRLLVVDDDSPVRRIVARVLERAGFEVVTAADGMEAVRVYREMAERVDCVLLDLSMPRLDGEETFRELRRIRPDARVVLVSGYAEEQILERFRGAGLAGILQKPVRNEVLVARIREVLEAAPPPVDTAEEG